MKKIAIVTLNGYHNFGNRLQNYAMQNTLYTFGFEPKTILYGSKLKLTLKFRILKIIRELSFLRTPVKYLLKKSNRFSFYMRELKFYEFSKEYINEVHENLSNIEVIKKVNKYYSFFVVGSDQVWNPFYTNGNAFYFLDFVTDNLKKIAISASFGVSKLPEHLINYYRTNLQSFKHISIREVEGSLILKGMFEKDFNIIFDPTLLVSKLEWDKISKPSVLKPKNRIMLIYFLGEITREYENFIHETSQKYKLEVVNINDVQNKYYYSTGPSEFIDFIKNSDLVLTDSYHGTIFSLIFNKPFVLFRREDKLDMNSRLSTLLGYFNVEDREFNNLIENKIMNMNFRNVNLIIEKIKNDNFEIINGFF